MFDIGFAELLVIAVLGLIVIGPKRLPEVVRAISLWIGRLRRSFGNLKSEMEKEFQLDDIRRQLHNEEIMRNLNASKEEIERNLNTSKEEIERVIEEASSPPSPPADEKASDK